MKHVALGHSDLVISALGLGCMGMSENYGPTNDIDNLAILECAVDLGINLLDTADSYGPHRNEELIGKFVAGRRERIVVATKFGFVRSDDPTAPAIDNSPAYIRRACEGSLRRLKLDVIDLYYVHRLDAGRAVEDTIGTLADLVKEGKVRAIGLSEVSAATLRRAAAVHPIAALESEYSLWAREPELEVLPACRDLGVTFVAFSPLGRGFLTGAIPPTSALAADDYRRQLPRFNGEAAAHNAALVARLAAIAADNDCSAGQLALAWLMAQGPDVIPIPGTRRIQRLEENAAAADLVLSPETRAAIDAVFPVGAAAGERYDADGMQLVNR
jgi:aryl-alcohol dehydrogenase-like predicted oxidoreductase